MFAIGWKRVREQEPAEGQLILYFDAADQCFSIGRFDSRMGDLLEDETCWISFTEPPGWSGGHLGMHK